MKKPVCWTMLGVLAVQAATVFAADRLERFLPANGNNVYAETNLLRRWPPGGPRELWRLDLGYGKSAVAVDGNRVFTLTQVSNQQYAVCLDAATGRTLWQRLLLPKGNNHQVRGPVCGPLLDGDRVYVFPYDNEDNNAWNPHSPCICLSATDGRELWRESAAFNCSEGTTPLIVGDTLYVGGGGRSNILAAVDKLTGKLRWKVAEDRDAGHQKVYVTGASIVYQEVGGIPQIIVCVFRNDVLGVHARDGRVLWHWPLARPPSSGMVPTPVALGSRVLLSGSQNSMSFSAGLEMTARNGGIEPSLVYESQELQCNMYHTPSVYNGAVFGFGKGPTGDALQCTRWSDGKLLWQQESPDWKRDRQLTVADGLIVAITRQDDVVLAEAGLDGYKELGRFHPGIVFGLPQQPMIAGRRLYLRGNDTLSCYELAPAAK